MPRLGDRGELMTAPPGMKVKKLRAEKIRPANRGRAQSHTGSALNAVAESFNSTVEFELLRSNHFGSREQARRAVAAWLDEYNTSRRHSTDLMLSPIVFERREARARTTAAAA